MSNRKRTVSLVLGSGGARGLAHIGVIQVLEEQGYTIESISGSCVVASCYRSVLKKVIPNTCGEVKQR